jgi:copper(I)-binding protein
VKAFLIAPFLLLAACGAGGAPDIQVMDAWARETVAGQSGTAAYATIVNRGSGDDRLLSVSAVPPSAASLHETSTQGGISSMRPLENGLEIPAGSSVELKPGGAHVMISGLTGPLQEGDGLKLTLRFERSGDRAVDFRVASATGAAGH